MTDGASPIVGVSWQPFRVPFAAAAQTSRSTLAVREGFIITLETADGALGTGEASPLLDFEGGELAEVSAALGPMADRLIGATPEDSWRVPLDADSVAEPSQRVARAGLETALADLLSRRSGRPLWAWLAARAGISVDQPVEVPANALVDGGTAESVAVAVLQAVRSGYTTVKVKVGSNPTADVDRVGAARRASPEIELRVDANGAWNDGAAIEVLRAFEPYHVALCEQPLDPRRADILEATARLRTQVGVRIALDESCRTAEHVRHIVAANAADAIVIKPMFTGLKAAVEMIRIAREARLPTIVTTTFDTGIGTSMAAHVAALLPNPRPACGLATLSRLEQSLVLGNALVERAVMCPPPGPGLGVSLDSDARAHFASGPEHRVMA